MLDPLDALPPKAREIAEVIGLDALMRLVEHYGGTRIRVHTAPRPDSDLAHCLGPEAYRRALQQTYQTEYLDVPLLHTSREALLTAEVLAARARGETVPEIARRHRIPLRRVYRISERETADRQERFDF